MSTQEEVMTQEQEQVAGYKWEVTAEWQAAVIAAYKDKGWSEAALARMAGMSQSGMWTLLHSTHAQRSEYVFKIHEILGWPEPQRPESQHGGGITLREKMPTDIQAMFDVLAPTDREIAWQAVRDSIERINRNR